MNYEKYMKSEEWKDKRWKALERGWHRCCLCGAEECLHVHHRSYDNLGDERPEDLEVLCKHCHASRHGKAIKGKRESLKVWRLSEILPSVFAEIGSLYETINNKTI